MIDSKVEIAGSIDMGCELWVAQNNKASVSLLCEQRYEQFTRLNNGAVASSCGINKVSSGVSKSCLWFLLKGIAWCWYGNQNKVFILEFLQFVLICAFWRIALPQPAKKGLRAAVTKPTNKNNWKHKLRGWGRSPSQIFPFSSASVALWPFCNSIPWTG